MKTREIVQKEALEQLSLNGYNGTVCLSTGTGKSAVAIEAIKRGGFEKILITSPRTNLKENWKKELAKWKIKEIPNIKLVIKYDVLSIQTYQVKDMVGIGIENIQTCYKWDEDVIKRFDLIIADEIHLIASPEYGRLISIARNHNIPVIGLTATPSLHDEFKDNFYKQYTPIVYEYYKSSKEGITNKIKYIVYHYRLSDDYKVIAGTKKKPFSIGEKTQYEFLSQQITKGQILMSQTGSTDWFKDAAEWAWNGQGTSSQRNAAMQYLNAIKYRKSFLWNLSSSAEITTELKNIILEDSNNKLLLFSELTSQADRLSAYSIHSKNDEEANKLLLYKFDTGIIRELSSVNSLTLGLNIKGANYAIIESFNSSDTSITQKVGRLTRLDVNDTATVIIIVPEFTQAEEWFKKFSNKLDFSDALYISSIQEFKNYFYE